MTAITVRLNPDLKERLRIESLIRNVSQNEIITDAITHCLEADHNTHKAIRDSIVAARSKGRRSKKDSLKMAKKVAELDIAEGLGELKVVRQDANRGK
jgi:predicted transcriptional regulator